MVSVALETEGDERPDLDAARALELAQFAAASRRGLPYSAIGRMSARVTLVLIGGFM